VPERYRAAIHIDFGGIESQFLYHDDGLDGELTLQGLLYPIRAASNDR
jgi:hypothetical protein